jgi:hypothetical protein
VTIDFWKDLEKGESPIRQWDKLVLGGVVLPGVWTVDARIALDIDIAKQKGSLPTLTDNGYRPAQIKAVGKVWTKDQWDELQELLPEILPSKRSTVRDSFDISHPATSLIGVKSVIITEAVPKHPDNEQTFALELTMMEWFPETAIEKKKVKPPSRRSAGGALRESEFQAAPPNAGANLT